MRTKRDRRRTPLDTSLVQGKSGKQSNLFDVLASTDATLPDSVGSLKANDTASVKTDSTISALPSVLNGEGTLKVKTGDNARIISTLKKSTRKETRKKTKNNHRVGVLNPDGTPAMPTTNRRANKWIKEGKAKKVKNKLGIFQVQLLVEPSGRNKQPIVLTVDPGSVFTGIGVISKKAVLYGAMLELPGYKKGSKGKIITNRFGKKIEKYLNTIVEGMIKRRELRRGRRYRKTRRRPERWLNRSKTKIAPSILTRKQLEYKVIRELVKIYPITGIGFEDIKFNHYKDLKGEKGQFFSHVEVGKNWILKRLILLTKKYKMSLGLRVIKGWETNIRRQQLGLKKEGDKTERIPESHVTDCIAMGSIMLDGTGLGIEIKNKFKFDVITRPKYSRRILHLEQPGKGGFRRRYGGTTCIDGWTDIRKGDYVEAIQGKKVFRSYVSGFTTMKGSNYIYVSDFDWKGFGKNGTQTAIVPSNIRILNRNNGLLIKNMVKIMATDDIVDRQIGFKTVQRSIENAWE